MATAPADDRGSTRCSVRNSARPVKVDPVRHHRGDARLVGGEQPGICRIPAGQRVHARRLGHRGQAQPNSALCPPPQSSAGSEAAQTW